MRLLFDILLGAGLAGAAGLRPFLPVLLAGAAALVNARLDFGGTDFSFMESVPWLVAMAVLAAAAIGAERRYGGERLERGPAGAALAGAAIGLGALLFAASLADDRYTWWPGLVAGIACATLGQVAARGFFARVRARLDADARSALPVYAEGGALLSAALVLLFPPLAVVVLGFLVWLLAGGRRRTQQKYAGLRVLR